MKDVFACGKCYEILSKFGECLHVPGGRRLTKNKCLGLHKCVFLFLLFLSNFFIYAIFGERGGAGRSPRHHFLLFLKGMVHTPPFPANKGGAIRGEEKEMLLWCQSFLHLLLPFPFLRKWNKKTQELEWQVHFCAAQSHLETLAIVCSLSYP